MTSFPFINKPTMKTVRQSVRIYILSSFFFYTKRNFNECIFQWNKSVIILKKKSFLYWLNRYFIIINSHVLYQKHNNIILIKYKVILLFFFLKMFMTFKKPTCIWWMNKSKIQNTKIPFFLQMYLNFLLCVVPLQCHINFKGWCLLR